MSPSSVLDGLTFPLVLAPLAGGPSTPELCAAVSEAGGLGFLAAGYLSAAELGARIARTRELTDRPFGVNLFVPGPGGDPAEVAAYATRLEPEVTRSGIELGEPHVDDDDWTAKLRLLTASPAPVVSFTFGCPESEVVDDLRGAGSEVWVTVTSAREAEVAERAGADGLAVQGAEAGGHRGGFTDDDAEPLGLLALLKDATAVTSLPLVAAGGIMSGAGLAAALNAGAHAGAMGTAFLLTPEAGTATVHRHALASDAPTALTRAFTGRLARGIRNRFLDEYSADAPSAYPQVHHLTAPLRAHGRTVGDAGVVNLWAGDGYRLASAEPAGEIVKRVGTEALELLRPARTITT